MMFLFPFGGICDRSLEAPAAEDENDTLLTPTASRSTATPTPPATKKASNAPQIGADEKYSSEN